MPRFTLYRPLSNSLYLSLTLSTSLYLFECTALLLQTGVACEQATTFVPFQVRKRKLAESDEELDVDANARSQNKRPNVEKKRAL